MVKLCSIPQGFQPVRFNQGDCVRYIGTDPKIQQDYGNQDLQILAIDFVSETTVCKNKAGNCLVGVSYRDLQHAQEMI